MILLLNVLKSASMLILPCIWIVSFFCYQKKKKMSATKKLRSLSALIGSPPKTSLGAPGTPPVKRSHPQPLVNDLTELYELLCDDRRQQTEEMMLAIQDISEKVKGLEVSLSSALSRLDKLEIQFRESKDEASSLQQTVVRLQTEVADLKGLVDHMEEKQEITRRLPNVVISGIPEDSSTNDRSNNVLDAMREFISQKLTVTNCNIVSARRLGSPVERGATAQAGRPRRPRLVLVQFGSLEDKIRVLKERSRLKGLNIYLNDDLTKLERERRREALPRFKELRKRNVRVQLRRDRIFHDGKPLTLGDVDRFLSLKEPNAVSDRMDVTRPNSS